MRDYVLQLLERWVCRYAEYSGTNINENLEKKEIFQ